ncbi:MAG: biotin--[acetyl-CoA-carboxylase] ligase [Ruminococcaceae bacterium]|nr:biotin--[acetyl-CoA-carboxylase] ligase [Oscillospiraceae bacterium]
MLISDIYDLEVIKKALPEGADAICIKETDSTNNMARELISQGVPHGTVILADRQTAGRGRRGNCFYSPDGGIYMSVILNAENIPYTVCAASAVCRVLRSFGVDAGIKWVNDIFIDGKKVCGILCERIGDHVIVGIGINHSVEKFPPELETVAASLPIGVPNREKTVAAVLCELFNVLDNVDDAKAYYKENMMLYGKKVNFDLNGAKKQGTVIGLGDNEELLIKTANETVAITSGMVTLCVQMNNKC